MERPKRRKYRDNPYTLIVDDNTYKVIFSDSRNVIQIIEVSFEIFDVLDRFELDDLSQMNEYDRHIEHFELEDISYNRLAKQPMSVEEMILNELLYSDLKNEISKLPEIQKRRLVLYFFYDMTLQEIANMENCSPRAIKDSIDISIKKLKKIKF